MGFEESDVASQVGPLGKVEDVEGRADHFVNETLTEEVVECQDQEADRLNGVFGLCFRDEW